MQGVLVNLSMVEIIYKLWMTAIMCTHLSGAKHITRLMKGGLDGFSLLTRLCRLRLTAVHSFDLDTQECVIAINVTSSHGCDVPNYSKGSSHIH